MDPGFRRGDELDRRRGDEFGRYRGYECGRLRYSGTVYPVIPAKAGIHLWPVRRCHVHTTKLIFNNILYTDEPGLL